MCRGIPYCLLSGVLLLATTDAVNVNLTISRGRTKFRVRDPSLENEQGLAEAAIGTASSEAGDTPELVEAERKLLARHLYTKAESFLPKSMANDDSNTLYLIASFPELRVVNYVRLPDLVWRPLIAVGLTAPKAVVVDGDRMRVYVADAALAKISWYQLLALPSGQLISDGREHKAVQFMSVRNMALDLEGNLWFSGVSTPTPPMQPVDAVYKQPRLIIDQMALSGADIPPLAIWTSGVTQSTASPISLDAFNIYWGNDMDGSKKGSVVRAGQSGGSASGLAPMADNSDTTYSIAVTPTAIFYGVDNAIYGVLKTKVGASCGSTGDLCKVVSDLVKKPTAMFWDGDGTVYVADNGAGAIYSFASGSVSPHALDKLIDAGQVWGLGVLNVVHDQQGGSVRSLVSQLLLSFLLGVSLVSF